jgi:hypothetical protein
VYNQTGKIFYKFNCRKIEKAILGLKYDKFDKLKFDYKSVTQTFYQKNIQKASIKENRL